MKQTATSTSIHRSNRNLALGLGSAGLSIHFLDEMNSDIADIPKAIQLSQACFPTILNHPAERGYSHGFGLPTQA
jgi:hypothetical protein